MPIPLANEQNSLQNKDFILITYDAYDNLLSEIRFIGSFISWMKSSE